MLAIGALIARAAFNADVDVLGVITALGTLALALVTWREGNVVYRERERDTSQAHHQPGALGFLMAATLVIALVALIVAIVL